MLKTVFSNELHNHISEQYKRAVNLGIQEHSKLSVPGQVKKWWTSLVTFELKQCPLSHFRTSRSDGEDPFAETTVVIDALNAVSISYGHVVVNELRSRGYVIDPIYTTAVTELTKQDQLAKRKAALEKEFDISIVEVNVPFLANLAKFKYKRPQDTLMRLYTDAVQEMVSTKGIYFVGGNNEKLSDLKFRYHGHRLCEERQPIVIAALLPTDMQLVDNVKASFGNSFWYPGNGHVDSTESFSKPLLTYPLPDLPAVIGLEQAAADLNKYAEKYTEQLELIRRWEETEGLGYFFFRQENGMIQRASLDEVLNG